MSDIDLLTKAYNSPDMRTHLDALQRASLNKKIRGAVSNPLHRQGLETLSSLYDWGRSRLDAGGARNYTEQEAWISGQKAMTDVLGAYQRVQTAQKNNTIPAEEDLRILDEARKTERGSAFLNNAYRLSELQNAAIAGGPVPKKEESQARLNKQFGDLSFARQNYGILRSMQEMKANPITWILKTLFTNPNRFFRVVSALNRGTQKNTQWNRIIGSGTREYVQTLPWLNLLNNFVGSVVPSQEHQYWG